MSDPFIQRLSRWVVRQAQDIAALDPGDSTGSGHDEEAQRAHAPEEEGVRPLARAGLGLGQGVQKLRIRLCARTLSCCHALLAA